MPARLTPNQKDRLSDLGRRSRRLTPNQPSYGSFAIEAVEGAWVRLSDVGGERTLDHCESKGYVESREEIGPRGGRILFYRPTLAGWDWLVRQDRDAAAAVAAMQHPLYEQWRQLRKDGSTRMTFEEYRVCTERTAVPSDPTCRNCGTPDSWHSEDDGQCPDDDGPRYDSVAAYDARETAHGLVWSPLLNRNIGNFRR